MTDSYAILFSATGLLVSSWTCNGLLTLWAATSGRHRLLRCAAVLAVLFPLLMAPASELWSLFLLQGCTVAAGITIWRWRAARRQEGSNSEDVVTSKRRFTIQFSIRTLLALTGLVAMLTAISVPVVRNTSASAESWMETAVGGVCGGCAVLTGAWLAVARRKRLAWLAAALLCLGLASVVLWFDVWFMPLLFDYSLSLAVLTWFVIFSALAAMTWLLLCVWFAARTTPTGNFARTRQIAAQCLVCLLVVALALPPAYVVWQLNHPLPVPDLPAPQPNGMDDIVAAGDALGASPILSANVEPKSTEELAAEVAKYAGDYQRLRLGLARDVRAQPWAENGKVLDSLVMGLRVNPSVRQAARALMLESQLAQQQKRYGDAARIALENVHLGQAVARDGLLVDYLTGVAIEDMGDRSLYPVLPQLNAAECREITAALAGMERRRESIEDVLRRERILSENLYGWPYHLYDLLNRLVSPDHRQRMLGLRDREQAKTGLLIAELALRAYQLDHGTLPDQLEQLTPEYLTELPVDPFAPEGRPLRYICTEDGHVLYSIGRDGEDDGGRPPARNPSSGYELEGDGDLRLDVLFSRRQRGGRGR